MIISSIVCFTDTSGSLDALTVVFSCKRILLAGGGGAGVSCASLRTPLWKRRVGGLASGTGNSSGILPVIRLRVSCFGLRTGVSSGILPVICLRVGCLGLGRTPLLKRRVGCLGWGTGVSCAFFRTPLVKRRLGCLSFVFIADGLGAGVSARTSLFEPWLCLLHGNRFGDGRFSQNILFEPWLCLLHGNRFGDGRFSQNFLLFPTLPNLFPVIWRRLGWRSLRRLRWGP